KLVRLDEEDDGSSDSSSILSRKSLGQLKEAFQDFWKSSKTPDDSEKDIMGNSGNTKTPLGDKLHETSLIRTLQRYYASGNEARTEFMERYSSLALYKMAISAAEQVSIVLTNDNTAISLRSPLVMWSD
ncbi:hypothetical protein NW757_014601, partial [Fusarium falciforme]